MRRWLALIPGILLVACDEPTSDPPTAPIFSVVVDSASLAGGSVTLAQAAGIPIDSGDVVTVTITSANCSGQGSVTAVSGVLSGVVSADACNAQGASITLGPAPSAGNLVFSITDPRFGSGSFQVSGAFPNYTVGLDDGFGDGDFNDNVLSVVIARMCVTGNPILDDPAFRQDLLNALTQSGVGGPAQNRREITGYVYQQPNGSYRARPRSTPDPNATPCSTAPGGPELQAGETLAGVWHTHPFAAGDTLPPNCHPGQNVTALYDNQRRGGGSLADWNFADQFNIDMFIIDMNEVFLLPPGTPPANRGQNPNRWQWSGAACTF